MKKDILFIISTLRCGGAEHALVSLLNVLDYKKYNVDLMILCREGMFYRNAIPEQVNVIEPDLSISAVLEPTMKNMLHCLKKCELTYIWMHTKRIIGRILNNKGVQGNIWSNYWKKYGRYVHCLEKEYDASIGYLEGLSNYFCIDKVSAKCKIGWIHTNYTDSAQNKKMDQEYFPKFDYMVTMSEPASETLKREFPEISNQIHTIHNILDKKEVMHLAQEYVEEIEKKDEEIVLVSVGNILPAKGYDMAVEACKKLVQSGAKIKWYIVGREDQAETIKKKIEEYNLKETFILLGMKKNPYKYMNISDIYVQCSRYEGFSTTIREAKMLCKPIVATDCQGINDQIENGINGTLVDMNAESICQGILELVNDKKIMEEYTTKLMEDSKNENDMNIELKKLYDLIG